MTPDLHVPEWRMVGQLLDAVRRSFDVDVVVLTEYSREETVRAAVGDPANLDLEVGTTTSLDRSASLACTQGRLPTIVSDSRVDRTASRLLFSRHRAILTFGSVPVRLPDGHLYGGLCIAHSAPRTDLDSHSSRFLHSMAEVIALELARIDERRSRHGRERRELMGVLDGDGLTTVLQPIVRTRDGTTVGVEALSRFVATPLRPPDVWFAAAAKAGLGIELEAAAVSRALRHLDALPPTWYLALNASPALIGSGILHDLLLPIPGRRVVVEITEHVAIDDYSVIRTALAGMRARGVRLAIDDAGAGYASLRHVAQLEPELIKMDQSITRGCDREPTARALAATLIDLAARLGASLVAEAVETPDELATLRDLGAGLAQGYLFAAPGHVEDLRDSYPIQIPDGYPLVTR